MAKSREEHAQFQTEIMAYVDKYQQFRRKEREENNSKSPDTDFLIRLDGKEVVDFSSQYGSETSISYVACNLAGRTFVFPSYGDYTQTCVFRTFGPWWHLAPSGVKPYSRTPSDFCGVDFIEITFAQALYPVRIEVYETFNPGAIVRILACDRSAGSDVDRNIRWVTLWADDPKPCKQRPRIFAPRLRRVNFATSLIRLELNHQHLDYYTELDCIKLVGTTEATPACNPALLEDTHCFNQTGAEGLEETDDKHSQRSSDENTPSSTEGIDELSKGMNALSVEHDDDKSSFFVQLPKEIIHLILKYLNTRDLCRLAQTCSLLRDHCYDPLLYTDLNLQPYWTQISNSSLSSLVSRCSRLQRLNLSWLGKGGLIYSDHLAKFFCQCEHLQTLELSACKFLDSSALQMVLAACKNLTALNLSSCTNIEDFSAFNIFAPKKLQRINLYRTKVDAPSMIAILKACPDLEHVNISSCMFMNPYVNVVLMEMGDCCKKLKSLDLWRMKSVNSEGLSHLYNGCSHLEELDLGWCGDLKSASLCFRQLAQNCTGLKKVFLTANRTVCDDDVREFANHCPNLEQLDILGTREVTKKAIQHLLERCKKLIFLDVSFCLGMTSTDVWGWRSTYSNVAIKKSFQHVSIVD